MASPTEKYEHLTKLFEDNYGEVWRVKDLETDTHFDLRKFAPQLGRDPEFITNLRSACQDWFRLEHPNVQGLVKIVITDDEIFLLLEAVDGVRLSELVGDRFEELSKQSELSLQITKAVAHLHSIGVVHQDIQPNKIIVDLKTQRAILTDISISQALSGAKATKIGVIQAKFDYMPPEIMSGTPPTAQSDVYSLGLVIWEIFENEPACPKGPLPMQFQWHKLKGVKILTPKRMPDKIFEIVRSMAAIDPQSRPNSPETLVTTWPSEESLPLIFEKKSNSSTKTEDKETNIGKQRKVSGLNLMGGLRSKTAPPQRTEVEYFQGETPKHIRMEVFINNQSVAVYDLCTGPEVLFGRDNQKCDAPVLFEPISPQHLYPQNIQLSMKISSRHFSVLCEKDEAYFIDRGSANGSSLNGVRAEKDVKIPMADTIIFIADVLCFRPTISKEGDEIANVILHRQNNTTQKKHVVVRKSFYLSKDGLPTNRQDAVIGFLLKEGGSLRLETHNGNQLSITAPTGPLKLNDGQFALVKYGPSHLVLECEDVRINWTTVK